MNFLIIHLIGGGIDGSEVLTHFPPENTYNSELDTEFLIPAQKHFKEKAYLDEFISLFGVTMEEEVPNQKTLN